MSNMQITSPCGAIVLSKVILGIKIIIIMKMRKKDAVYSIKNRDSKHHACSVKA